MEPLVTTLLDLDLQLGGHAGLCVGGGLGLFLKQRHLRVHSEIRTLLPLNAMPDARTTEDIDLFLQAEIVVAPAKMKTIRVALDSLGFAVIDSAKYMQFVRATPIGAVKVDLLAGPLGDLESRVNLDSRRFKPKQGVGLHARRVDEAIGIEVQPLAVPISGVLSSGAAHTTEISVPQAFTYLMMKLIAFRDQLHNPDKDLGRHHALDAYRIVGLLTEAEDEVVRELSEQHRDNHHVIDARQVVAEHFGNVDAIGMLRIREHPLYSDSFRLDEFRRELVALFPPPGGPDPETRE